MSPPALLLSLLGLACSSVCVVAWLGMGFYILRWHSIWTAAEMQSRLQTWVSENGYRILSQRRPKELPLLRQIAAGVFGLPARYPWMHTVEHRTPWKRVETFSTDLTVVNSNRQSQSGRLVLVRTWRFLGWVFETRWEESHEEPPVLEEIQPRPQTDPMWDPWTDSPQAG